MFSDEFNDHAINLSKWTEVNQYRGNNSIVSWAWDSGNVWENTAGELIIRCKNENDGTYSAGCLESRDKYMFRYGYIEARIQLPPADRGHQGALWLQAYPGVNAVGDDANDGAEIDILEAPKKTDIYKSSVHFDGYQASHQSVGQWINAPGIHSGFHVFGLEWDPQYLKFYYDGVLKYTISNVDHVSDVNEFIRLSVGILDWCDGDITTSHLPTYTKFDWIRVYENTSSGGNSLFPDINDVIRLKSLTTDLHAKVTDPNDLLVAEGTSSSNWAKLKVEDAGGGWIKLKSKKTEQYVYVSTNSSDRLFATGGGSENQCKFKFEDAGNGYVKLKSFTSQNYVFVNSSGSDLRASGSGTGDASKFTWSETTW